jgi:RNA polymerase sigma-70 factor (ECF subfamily)
VTVTPIDSLRILEVMANDSNEDLYKEDPLEQLLDQETDEEFGLPEFREHFADSLTPAVLKDWTAQDFASIYVRFRPHLERHARRFLANRSQVEEVVQDAFLYLMTTLPELDSEVGVLRFLKWKTRLLALDVIRANSRASFSPIDDQPEFAAKLPEMSDSLEQADDAAIVSLALAKLQPRQREALIATLYEEKSAEVVAAQMNLSDNAFRQLLFRARSAFKKALVGEAETAGKTVSEILSMAARKAAAESGKYISAAGAFLLVLAIAIGVVPNLSNDVVNEQVALPEPTITSPETPVAQTEAPVPLTEEPGPEAEAVEAPDLVSATNTELTIAPVANVSPKPAPAPTAAAVAQKQTETALRNALSVSTVKMLGRSSAAEASNVVTNGSQGTVQVKGSSGLMAILSYDLSNPRGVTSAWISFEASGAIFVAASKVDFAEKIFNQDGSATLNYVATDLLVGDISGKFDYLAIQDSHISSSAIRVSVTLDSAGNLLGSSLGLTPRS